MVKIEAKALNRRRDDLALHSSRHQKGRRSNASPIRTRISSAADIIEAQIRCKAGKASTSNSCLGVWCPLQRDLPAHARETTSQRATRSYLVNLAEETIVLAAATQMKSRQPVDMSVRSRSRSSWQTTKIEAEAAQRHQADTATMERFRIRQEGTFSRWTQDHMLTMPTPVTFDTLQKKCHATSRLMARLTMRTP